nr:immunoglobulin light chain junction region [Macaca mulatta]MOX30559.1 immunoglobulin light chain junction region [Macaca mulatta]
DYYCGAWDSSVSGRVF